MATSWVGGTSALAPNIPMSVIAYTVAPIVAVPLGAVATSAIAATMDTKNAYRCDTPRSRGFTTAELLPAVTTDRSRA